MPARDDDTKPADNHEDKQEDSDDDFFDWFDEFFYGPEERKSKHHCDDEEETPSDPNLKENKAEEKHLSKVLHVKKLDLNVAENAKDHRTDKYDCTEDREEDGEVEPAELVIRRGQTFVVMVTFDRDFYPDKDDLIFHFETGKKAKLRTTTHGSFQVHENGRKKFDPFEWDGHIVSTDEKTVTIEIHPPADCAIGKWKIMIDTKSELKNGRTRTYHYKHSDKIYVLFNPWCKDDLTYMEDEYLLKEYVLNDHGCVYKGNKKRQKPKIWNFGQFEEGIIDISLKLLDSCLKRCKTSHNNSNPVWVARAVSKMVNCQNDKGVLVGNWSGKYEGGTSPGEWCGSVKILKEYARTGDPVKFGQCWVFSGVTTTVLRAIGIPARSVTNYMSAHDTDKSCTIDKIYKKDKDGVLCELEHKSKDSVWNFHVWNEGWFQRPDIMGNTNGQYDGWQALDSTPQERSDGVYQCGPCPVSAIKQGIVNVPHDTAFVFAEVNSDIVHWEETPNGYVRFKLRMNKVGQSMSTKQPDGKPFESGFLSSRKGRLDVTNCYKFKDGSEDSRKAVMRASLGTENSRGAYRQETEAEDIKFKLIHDPELRIGENLPVTLKAINKSSNNRTVSSVVFRFLEQKYTGQTAGQPFKTHKEDQDVRVSAGDSQEIKMIINREDYIDHLEEDGGLCIQALAVVKADYSRPQQNCVKSHTVQLEENPLEIKVPEKVKKGDKFEAIIKVDNPLDKELTDCVASFEGRGFAECPKVKLDNVRARSNGEGKIEMKAKRKGDFMVTFHFKSTQLQQVYGCARIIVE